MGINLHNPVRIITWVVFACVFIAVYSGILPDFDHFSGSRGILHEPYIWCLACLVFMGVTFGGRLFKSRILGG